MKTQSFFVVLFLFTFFLSCKKDTDDNAIKTKTELLTSKTWIYDEYFINYNSANTVLAYKRGKPNNSLNLSSNRSVFNADGTTSEINQNGTSVPGTWKFINNETQTQVTNSVGTFTANIISLTDDSFIWLDPNSSSGTYAKMIPQ